MMSAFPYPAHRKRRPGYTLLELLMYVAVAGVLITLCGKLFLTGSRLQAAHALTLDRINGLGEIEENVLRFVHAADAIAPSYGAYTTGESQLVLRAEPVDGAPHYYVLGALRDPKHLSVLEIIERKGAPQAEKFITYALPLAGLRFACGEAPGKARSVAFECWVAQPERVKKTELPLRRIVAALRGMDSGRASS
jgi:hypothetical protein